jgi:signal transduction histidine kinase
MARFYSTIGFKLFVALLAISLSLLGVGGYVFYMQSESVIKNEITASLVNTANTEKIRVEDAVDTEVIEFQLLAGRVLIYDYLKSYLDGDLAAAANVTSSLTAQLNTPYCQNIFFLDDTGTIKFQAKEGALPNPASQKMLHEMGSNGVNIAIDDLGSGPRVYICGPIILRGEYLCVGVIEKNLGVFTRIAEEENPLYKSLETVLAFRGPNGEAIFFSRLKYTNSTTTISPDQSEVPIIKALNGEVTLLPDNPDYRGVRVIAATRYIDSLKVGLVTKIDISEAYQPLYDYQNRLIILCILIVFVLVAFSYLFSRNLTSPITQLKAEVDKIGGGELYVSEIRATGGEIGALQASFRDMVEHLRFSFEQIEEKNTQLENLNKELEAFSYSVSHDLRAPLRSIDGFSKILLEDYDDKLDDTGRDYLHRVRAATLRMSQLIDDMLALSRITKMSLKFQDVDLSSVAQSISAELTRSEQNRKVEWRIQPGLVMRGDEALLKILIDNLLSNAWKFTSKKDNAVIEFGSMVENGETVFYTRDNGAGFDMQYVHKLFTPFQRLHSTNDYPGTGIGLAIIQRIINRHEGRVWAEGEEGKGATFYFTIKL